MNRSHLHREAVLAAEYVLAEINIVPGERVPIFDLIEDRGIWLSFEMGLERLLGIYQRTENVAGIAINAARPISLQRFTAAHELGHHELGHESQVDDEVSIHELSADPREVQAQTFAASLLMSELAVEARLEHRGHDPASPDLDAADVYLISAELGVSFQAAVTQLRALNRISYERASVLYRASPLAIKQEILGGRRPDDPRASVWRLTLADNHRLLVVDVFDELDIVLPEMGFTGHQWTVPKDVAQVFTVVNDRVVPADAQDGGNLFAGTGHRHVTLKAHQGGRARLNFELAQPWENGEVGSSLTFDVIIRYAPVSEVGQGISVNQHDQLFKSASD